MHIDKDVAIQSLRTAVQTWGDALAAAEIVYAYHIERNS